MGRLGIKCLLAEGPAPCADCVVARSEALVFVCAQQAAPQPVDPKGKEVVAPSSTHLCC